MTKKKEQELIANQRRALQAKTLETTTLQRIMPPVSIQRKFLILQNTMP
jgi:hypothetical protein